jgi:LacI family transcriptional regulator
LTRKLDATNRERHRPVPPAVTVHTVAARAGVSITTVSRVLNGKIETLSEETCRRVLAAAQELRYRPNSLAVGLRKGTTRTVGLIVPDISDAYFHLLARGVEDVAQAAGYAVIFCNTDRIPEKERRYVDMLREKQVEAVIFAGGGVDNDRHLRDALWPGAKVVLIGPHRLRHPTVGVDNRAAIAAAVGHLAEQGCRRIACVAGRPEWLITRVRNEGYRQGLREAGLSGDPRLVWESGFTIARGEEAVARALEAGLAFDGVVAFNDYSAIGAIRALKAAGLRVPEDVAVVGCDDIPLASLVDPQLTSLAFPLYDFGATAMRMVLEMTAGATVSKNVAFPFQLKVRASSQRVSG